MIRRNCDRVSRHGDMVVRSRDKVYRWILKVISEIKIKIGLSEGKACEMVDLKIP